MRDSRTAPKSTDIDDSLTFSRRSFLSSVGAFLAMQTTKLRAATFQSAVANQQLSLCMAVSKTRYPPLLEKFIARLDPDADDFVSEQFCKRLQKVLDVWSAAICKSNDNVDAILFHLAESLRASSLAPSQTVPLRATGPLRIEKRFYESHHDIGCEQFSEEWKDYLASFATIETCKLEIYGIRITSESPRSADTEIRVVMVGTARDGSREQRVSRWRMAWVDDASAQDKPRWTVKRWTVCEEIRSRLIGPGFIDVTRRCLSLETEGMSQLLPGIDHWRSVLDGASGIDVYGNHGIAAGDIDGNGFDSFYVCQPSGLPNRLYHNRGNGTFEDITEVSGTGILDGTASALFADFQNRGRQDLLVVRSGGPLLFGNLGNGRFEPRPDAFHFARPPQGTFTSATVADYDRDGRLDVYFCLYSYYKGLNHHQYPTPYYDAQNGPPNFLFRNSGDGSFEDVTQQSGLDQNNNRFSFAAAWCDYDDDGWPDLYVANDFGRKNLYHNNGDGTFTDIAATAGVEDYGPGMSACWLDHDNDGLMDIYVANMWLAEGQRITADEHFLPGVDPTIRAHYQKHNAGNSLYRNVGNGQFQDRTAKAGMAMGGWSWSCASWDFDNDGWPDLYLANGFVSGPNHDDLQSFFWRQVAQRSVTASGVSPEYELAWNAINELVRADYSWSGYQRNAFFANNRDGSFSDVSGALGLDLIDDSRAFALSDFDHDGRLEFVLKNRTGPQVKILRNSMDNIGNSITIRLQGTVSNRDAIGATVTIDSRIPRQSKFVSAGSGFASQHTKELCFGLGTATDAISISVRWPTGNVDHYQRLPVNHRVVIEEGAANVKAMPYAMVQLESSAPSAVAHSYESDEMDTWLIVPLFGPDLLATDQNGVTRRLSELQGQPVLLTFLRAGCEDSQKQFEELREYSAVLSNFGILPFAVAISSGNDAASIDKFFSPAGVSFRLHLADELAAGAWNIQYRYLFDRRRDMPLPLSFLLDEKGAILRIYRGVTSPEKVASDWRSAPQTAEERFARATPFRGPYFGEAMKHDYLSFGIAFSEYGYVDEARSAFQRALDANPELEVAWFNLGTIYFGKGLYREARKCLTEAVRLNPRDSDAWNNLGAVSGMEQKLDEALDEFKQAAEADPHHANAVENIMRIYEFQGRPSDAQKTLEKLIERAPDDAGLHFSLSMTLMAQDDLKHAQDELETSLRLNPNNPDAINNLGAVLLRMGFSREALAQFELCRRIAPDFNRAAINTAIVYSKIGDQNQARQVLNEFLMRHPDDPDVRDAMAKIGNQ